MPWHDYQTLLVLPPASLSCHTHAPASARRKNPKTKTPSPLNLRRFIFVCFVIKPSVLSCLTSFLRVSPGDLFCLSAARNRECTGLNPRLSQHTSRNLSRRPIPSRNSCTFPQAGETRKETVTGSGLPAAATLCGLFIHHRPQRMMCGEHITGYKTHFLWMKHSVLPEYESCLIQLSPCNL